MKEAPKLSKSRSGCAACKKKRMKCDESQPSCRNCLRRGVECPGYTRQLKWSTKYERLKPTNTQRKSEKHSSANRKDAPAKSDYSAVEKALRPRASHRKSRTEPEPTLSLPELSSEERIKDASPEDMPTGEHFHAGLLDDIDQHVFEEILGNAEQTLDMINQSESGSQTYPWGDSLLEGFASPWFDHHMTTWTISFMDDGDKYAEAVLMHYFDAACRVMSCFDSPTNPYRTNIPQSLEFSPHIFHCLMSMSAAHLSNYSEQMSTATLTYQTKAVNMLQEEMARLALAEGITAEAMIPSARYHALLGTIILGMTSAWHDPTKYALSHLQGARVLFKAWRAEQGLIDDDGNTIILDREQSFIVGSMAYWECLASFLTDQAMDAVDYLLPFCNMPEGQIIYPHPWTGVSMPIWVYLAQTGVLMRQKRVMAKLSQIKRGCPMASEASSGLLEDARVIHERVVNYALPARDTMEETGDERTPLNHLCDVAKVYRFIALLELYQAFPSLANQSNTSMDPSLNRDLVFDLATSALTIISDLPRESGTPTVLAVAYISAGSALQHSIAGTNDDSKADMTSLQDELSNVRHSKPAVQWWRDNVRQQILHAHRQLGLVAVQRGAKLVQEVWNRSDIQAEMVADLKSVTPVHWMDVMIEQRLETLYG